MSMATVDCLAPNSPSVTLTIRLLMQKKEVGSIIGKKGDNIKKFREQSGAKITISDGTSPERIVTVTGCTNSILKAFSFIARKFEEDQQSTTSGIIIPKQPVTLRLIVPASQCGSLIGKGGSKIKEIREITGASIRVADEMLPNSTERAVTISGASEAISRCIYQICCVMMECPPEGATIPYRPNPGMPPVIFAGGQAYIVQGQYAILHPDLTKLHQLALQHAPLLPGHNVGSLNPQGSLCVPSLGNLTVTSTELTIPNDLIGCVIGKGGAKINEIRQLSGATIKISDPEEGSRNRTVTISGTPEAVNLAQYLIDTSTDANKGLDLTANLSSTSANTMYAPNHTLAIPLSQLVNGNPHILGLSSGSGTTPTSSGSSEMSGMSKDSRKTLVTKMRAATSQNGNKKTERNKFTPY